MTLFAGLERAGSCCVRRGFGSGVGDLDEEQALRETAALDTLVVCGQLVRRRTPALVQRGEEKLRECQRVVVVQSAGTRRR